VSSSNAVKMRFDEVNDKGGIQGRKIRLVGRGTRSTSPARGQGPAPS